jgi:hypothetical protein
MTPASYLEKYCRVTDRRKVLYKRVFDKYKKKAETGQKDDYVDLKVKFSHNISRNKIFFYIILNVI